MAETPHAVTSTGPETTALAGGRSRRTPSGVPVLELRDELVDAVAEAQRKLVDADEQAEYLVGHVALMHTASGLTTGEPDVVLFEIGGETLDEAAKSCVGAFEDNFSTAAPSWVASSSEDLAEVLSDHYGGCPVRSLSEDLTP